MEQQNLEVQTQQFDTSAYDLARIKRNKWRRRRNLMKGWLFVLPVVLLMGLFTFYPLFRSFVMAFQNNYISTSKKFDSFGIENFKYVLEYAKFKYCLINTLVFAFISVPVSTILALFISVGLNSIKKVREVFQTLFFLPYLTNSIAVGAVFAAMFNVISTGAGVIKSPGLINTIFGTNIDWTSTSVIDADSWGQALTTGQIWPARWVVIIYEIWAGLPFKILILFGALQNDNKQYYDAAKIDGASKWTTLRKITVPLISPMLSYLIITGFIGGFKSYTAVVGIFGKQNMTGSYINTVVGFIYDQVGTGRTGLAAAAALILLVIIMIFTLINLHVSKKRVHY